MDEFLEYAKTAVGQHGHLDLRSARRDDDEFILRLAVEEDGTDAPKKTTWEVRFSRVREHRIALGWADVIAFTSDHVLLWPHVRPWASLYFFARPAAPLEVVGQLWERHRELASDWMPLERFLNANVPVAELLGAGHGLLATAPEPLVSEYAGVLDSVGSLWSIAGRHTPTS